MGHIEASLRLFVVAKLFGGRCGEWGPRTGSLAWVPGDGIRLYKCR